MALRPSARLETLSILPLSSLEPWSQGNLLSRVGSCGYLTQVYHARGIPPLDTWCTKTLPRESIPHYTKIIGVNQEEYFDHPYFLFGTARRLEHQSFLLEARVW